MRIGKVVVSISIAAALAACGVDDGSPVSAPPAVPQVTATGSAGGSTGGAGTGGSGGSSSTTSGGPTSSGGSSSSGGSAQAPGTVSKTAEALPAVDLSGMRLWGYDGKWHASQWDNHLGAHPWRYDHVTQNANGDVELLMNRDGAPELQGQTATGYYKSGLWEADVTIPQLREGVVVAPFWLFNNNTREELDFEFPGTNGLDVTIHAYPDGQHRTVTHRISSENWSGRRVRFGIRLDVDDGWAEMYINGKMVHRFEEETLGFFATRWFKPVSSVWAVRPGNRAIESWAGRWQGFSMPDDRMVMTVHGFRYTPLD